MNIPGAPLNNLNKYHYEELLALLRQAISEGDYAGGKLFDQKAAEALVVQGKNFSDIPIAVAGQIALADSLNYPLQQILARYVSAKRESDFFVIRINQYITLLKKEAELIDQQIATANLQTWISSLPSLSLSTEFGISFESGNGPIGFNVPLIDPLHTSVIRSPDIISQLAFRSFLQSGDAAISPGLLPYSTSRDFIPISMDWSVNSIGQTEQLTTLTGATSLTILEPSPLRTLTYPKVTQVLPTNSGLGNRWSDYFSVIQVGSEANTQVYLRTVKSERSNKITGVFSSPFLLSPYLSSNDLIVISGTTCFTKDVDYSLSDTGLFNPINISTNNIEIYFQEMFPGYQTSSDGKTWSKIVVLDEDRPNPETNAGESLTITNHTFPITDEQGAGLGIALLLNALPHLDYTIFIEPQSSSLPEYSTLTLEFESSNYMNGISLRPLTNYPSKILAILIESFPGGGFSSVFDGHSGIKFDQEVVVRFPDQLVRSAKILFSQENYSLKSYLVDPDAVNKQNTLAGLQAILPFSEQQIKRVSPLQVSGAKYEFGASYVEGRYYESHTSDVNSAIQVSGKFQTEGQPNLIRFDADLTDVNGTFCYLGNQETDTNGNVSALTFTQINTGTCFKYNKILTGTLQTVDFYLMFVAKSEFSRISKCLLQVSNV